MLSLECQVITPGMFRARPDPLLTAVNGVNEVCCLVSPARFHDGLNSQ